MLLKDTGGLLEGETQSFLGRLITNRGNYMELKLSEGYIKSILKEANMVNCSSTTTPGTSTNKHSFEDSEPLSTEQHSAYRRVVGKLQWLTYTRPDISYSTKELARSLQQPTAHDWKKVKHLLRYLAGTAKQRTSTWMRTGPAAL